MNLTKIEKSWIKQNKNILRRLFKKRINELIWETLEMEPSEERDINIRFVQDLLNWLADIKIIEDEKEIIREPFI